nr:FtsX-like permease family protein [Nocardioides convexus]
MIGVLTSSGASSSGTSEDDQAVVPVGTASRLTGSTAGTVSTIYVEARSEATLAAAYQEVQALLANRHDVTTADADFSIATQDSLVETANETNRTFTVLLGGVAGISLLVGGIGVMNIMLVSVTERIREIGLRKALGAAPRVIRRQFLVEASLLGLTGGIVGVLVGVAGAQVLPHFIDQTVAISALATLAALATSLALGVGFGVYPAGRAARLTPIDALRSE